MTRDGVRRDPAGSPAPTAVLVGDDQTGRALVRLVLEEDGWRAAEVPLDATLALRMLHQERDAVSLILILDTLQSEEPANLGVLHAARQDGLSLPAVVLAHHASLALRQRAADLGVRDVVDLPAMPRVLQERLRFALGDDVKRRARVGPNKTDEMIRAGGLTLRVVIREVSDRTGWTARVTRREATILARLMQAPGHLIPREDLLNAVWGEQYNGAGNVLEVYICRLRGKLAGTTVPPGTIRTIRQHGYVFDARHAPRDPLPEVARTPTKVLVINGRYDGVGVVEAVKPFLTTAGYQVEQAFHEEQLNMVRWQRPALILLDTRTLTDGGRGIRALLRTLPGGALIPIIAIVERGQAHLWPRDLDVDDYLLAPVDPDELLWRTWRAVHGQGPGYGRDRAER